MKILIGKSDGKPGVVAVTKVAAERELRWHGVTRAQARIAINKAIEIGAAVALVAGSTEGVNVASIVTLT